MTGSIGQEFNCDQGWTNSELGEIDFGDSRLTRRLLLTAELLSSMPMSPINQASQDWASTKAAYRLFSNDKINANKLLDAHQGNTIFRAEQEEVVLAIQDTTYLNYKNHHSCKGLGYIQENLKGVIVHNTLLVTPQGLPLGLLGQNKSTRETSKKPEHYTNRSLEERESYRWIEALRETVKLTKKVQKVVTVCDREADIYDFLQAAHDLDTYYLVRANHKRAVVGLSGKSIFETLKEARDMGHVEIHIPSRAGQKARKVEASIRFKKLTIKPPTRAKEEALVPLELFAIMVSEVARNSEVPALQWILLTNDTVTSLESAVEKIQWYKARWQIEIYHKVLKSGCKVEECRLETIERLYRYLTLFGIIAWRIYWLTHINRTNPDASVRIVLSEIELSTLAALANKKSKKRVQIKTVRDAVIEIAKLGGFLARRNDGSPGPTVIWRGWQRLSHSVFAVEAYKEGPTCG